VNLVSRLDVVSMYTDPSTWIATAIIDDLETVALECREAAAGHRREPTPRSLESIPSLDQVAETCEEIIQAIRAEYLGGAIETHKRQVAQLFGARTRKAAT
jgi:hypothetical protein